MRSGIDSFWSIWFSNWRGYYRYDGESVAAFTKMDGLPGTDTPIIEDRKGNLRLAATTFAAMMENPSPTSRKRMASSIPAFGRFWRTGAGIFG